MSAERHTTALGAAVADAVAAQAGEDAVVIALFVDGALLPPLQRGRAAHVVYALPTARVAGLRSWRDGLEAHLEVADETWTVVALEASTWARLVLRGHPGPSRWLSGALVDMGRSDAVAEHLRELAARAVDGRAAGWLEAAGAAPPPTGAARPSIEEVEAWLTHARRVADAASPFVDGAATC